MLTLCAARRGLAVAISVGVLLALAGATGATTGSLPGGTSIGVSIATPANGSTLPPGPVSLTGTVEVGTGVAVPSALLFYVLDLSGSTSSIVSGSACGQQNTQMDLVANTILDCEIAAARAVNQRAIGLGTVAEVGAIGFAGAMQTLGGSHTVDENAQTYDLDPTADDQIFVVPNAGATGSSPPFVEQALQSSYLDGLSPGRSLFGADGMFAFTQKEVGASTNYWAAIKRLKGVLSMSPLSRKVVIFMSDGDSNEGGPLGQHVSDQLAGISGMTIHTFAIGNSASCSPGTANFGTLQEIANATGGTCTRVTNPNILPALLPGVIASTLTSVTTKVDANAATAASVAGGVPHPGPVATTWMQTVTLAAGPHHICATANGTDGGGAGSTMDCIDITVKAPPMVSAGVGGTTSEGSAFALAGTASDGYTSWTASGGTGTCSFADPTSPTSSVTCTDDGTYTLTLTANDHVNPPVNSATTLVVTNVAPTATLTLSPSPHPLADAVSADVAISDPGADTFTCSLDWGDGTVDAAPVSGGTCHGSHVYASGGTRTVLATVTDDDGGVGQDSKPVTIDTPPTIILSSTPPSGVEGSPIPITADTADDGTTTSHWSVTPDPANDAGSACTVADPSALSTTVACNDDGTFTLTLAVDDGVNPTVTSNETLTVNNAAPQVAHGVVAPGPHPQDQPVPVSWSFTDAGSNDTQTCSINWGDGSPAGTGLIAGGMCSGAHSFTSGGSFVVVATITDDDGDSGSDGVTIAVDAPPSVSAGPNLTGNEGALITLTGLVNDDQGATSMWSATPGAGVDAGAVCTFGNPLSAATTVSCTDDGTWTLTLTGNDGVNAPVTSTATLTLTNVAPALRITSATVGGGLTVSLTAAIAAAGANDVLSCSIDWGDGTTSTATPVAGACSASHTYTGTGSRTITVTGSDDDGGSAQVSTTITLNNPPDCTAVTASSATLSPANGKFVLVTLSGATDLDGDSLRYTINGVTQDEPRGADPDAQRVGGAGLLLRAQRDGTGDGRVYIVSYSVSDGQLTCAGTVRVTVAHDQAHPVVLSPRSYNSF